MKKILFLVFVTLFSSLDTLAKEWKIINEKSSINFSVLQNQNYINGKIKNFNGKIYFDINNIDKSSINIEIDLASISLSLKDGESMLKDKSWLHINQFPLAYFSSNKISKISENKYRAYGFLEIKGIKSAIEIEFDLRKYDKNEALVEGFAKIHRSQFSIGPNDARNSHGIADDISINFVINAI